ncbi:MAG: methyl-accepting chemotaxis protein [Spirulinaceae cyanobacterium]
MNRQSKLQTNILFLLLASIIVPIGVLSSYSVISANRTITEVVRAEKQGDSDKVINFYLKGLQEDLYFLSKTPPIQGIVRARENEGVDPTDESTEAEWQQRLEMIFSSFIETNETYYQLRYLNELGQEMIRVDRHDSITQITPPDRLQNKRDTDYFQETIALDAGEIYVSKINLNRENGQIEEPYRPVIRYAIPIYNAAGQKRGIVIINALIQQGFDLGEVEENKAESRDFLVVNTDGDYLVHPDPEKEWGFELGHDANLKQDYLAAVAEEILTQDEGFISQDLPVVLYYNRVTPDPGNPASTFIMIYQSPKAAIFAASRQLTWLTVLMVVLTLGVVTPLVILLLRRLVGSILELTGTVTSFSDQLLATLDTQGAIAEQQSQAVQQTTATIEELHRSSQQSARQAENALHIARQAIERLGDGNDAMGRSVSELQTLKTTVEAVASHIQDLRDKATQIGQVSGLVGDLANQTNMLALNASIEAVRAGEQGRGFAVVAAEIRNLADQSLKSGEQIKTLVQDIQQAVQTTVSSATTGTDNVAQGNAIAQETATILGDVTQALQTVLESNQQIAHNSSEQASAIQHVSTAMNTLNQGAQENAQSISQTRAGAEKLTIASEELEAVI